MKDEDWTHNGGDLPAAARAAAGGGVYVHVQVEPLGTFMAGDLAGEVRAAWDSLLAALPDGAVAFREGWFSIGAVVAGDRRAAIALGRQVVHDLAPRTRIPPYRVAVVLIAIDPDAPEAALEVDVSDHLHDVDEDAIVWVSGDPSAVTLVKP
jgi:hypothetical protein